MSNFGLEAVDLFGKFEAVSQARSDGISDQIEELADEMSLLQQFLSAISQHTEDSTRIDWSHDPEKRELLARIAEKRPHLIPPGTLGWKNGKEIQALMAQVQNTITHEISPQLNFATSQATQEQYKLNEVLGVMTNMLKDYKEAIAKIQRNIIQAHG